MPELIPILTRDAIEKRVTEIAHDISVDYKDCELILIAVLKGAFIFLSDLVRRLAVPAQIDFLRIASYGSGTASTGNIQLAKGIEMDVRDKDVLVVEDIVDTGLTLSFILAYLQSFKPRSLKVCALLDKRQRRETDIAIDYIGHRIQKGFLVGYGLDYAEQYRNLPEIYQLNL